METLETLSLVCCLSIVGLLAVVGIIFTTAIRNFRRGMPKEFLNYGKRDWSQVFSNRRRRYERW